MKRLNRVYTLLILLSLTAIETTTALSLNYAKNGCNDTCGTVRIPYPFGIGANCSVNKWYTVDCKSSTPYLGALNQLQVLGVDLEHQTVTVNTPRISDCNRTNIFDLGRSPFLISKTQNKFIFKGCGNAIMMDNGNVLTGCSTYCPDDIVSESDGCFGLDCCQATIPRNLMSYSMNLTGLGSVGGDSPCRSAFLVDKDSYLEGRFSVVEDNSNVPISLLWTLSERDHANISCCMDWYRVDVDLGNGTSIDSWKCNYNDNANDKGNPYLTDGCQLSEECIKCKDGGGYSCHYDPLYGVDGLITRKNFTCEYYDSLQSRGSKSSQGVVLGVSISMGVVFLIATSYVSYKMIKKTKERRQRKRFFKRNGGLLLKQQQEADPNLIHRTIHFTSRELEKATDNFNKNRILGQGGQGTVYKGMLVDGRIVAIKKSKLIDDSQLEQFINEVLILSQVNHKNVVKLLGCCLKTDVPLLVSEFIPNGTLYDLLHNETDELPISLNMRLQVATEVAGALAYLHSATSIPIYHRDIKTTNILLDEKYRAKVSDFGTSRFVAIDQTHLTTSVKGTIGYLDPEYFQSSQFTEKSDVYSFGVVLIELLTGERAISLTRLGEYKNLATHFMLAMDEGRVLSILDTEIVKEGVTDDLMALANLAKRCLNLNGKYRPTMKEVAIELDIIWASNIPSKGEDNIIRMSGEELSMQTYAESSSTFMSLNNSISE